MGRGIAARRKCRVATAEEPRQPSFVLGSASRSKTGSDADRVAKRGGTSERGTSQKCFLSQQTLLKGLDKRPAFRESLRVWAPRHLHHRSCTECGTVGPLYLPVHRERVEVRRVGVRSILNEKAHRVRRCRFVRQGHRSYSEWRISPPDAKDICLRARVQMEQLFWDSGAGMGDDLDRKRLT